MAGSTVIYDTGMVECCGFEALGIMTDPTILIGRNMSDGFASGKSCTMASAAIVDDASVIEGGRYKACCLVTHNTILIGRNMTRRRNFSTRSRAVMAGGTTVNDILMIKCSPGECLGVMAQGAILVRCYRNMVL